MSLVKTTNWPLLGLTRFLLAAIVAISHLTWFLEKPQQILLIGKLSGLAAVFGFLVISGYSIANSYDNQPEGFYTRRVIRILPLYVVCVSFSALLPVLFGSPIAVPGIKFVTPTLSEFVGNLLFLQGFATASINTNAIVWTMSLEIFFYIMTPLLAKQSNTFLLTLTGLSVLSFLAYPFFSFPAYADVGYGLNIFFLGWCWLFGFWYFRTKSKIGPIIFFFFLGISIIAFNGQQLQPYWPVTWTLICCALWCSRFTSKTAFPKVMNMAGNASYPIYLLHIPIYIVAYCLTVPTIGILYFLLVTGAALFTFYFFDRPIKIYLQRRRSEI